MPEPLEAELVLETAGAERAVEELRREVEAQLQAAVESFSDAYASAASGLPPLQPDVDAAGIETAVSGAVSGAPAEVEPTADTQGLETAVTGAVSDAPAEVEPTAETTGLVAGIESAASGATAEVEPTAETTGMVAGIESAAAAATAEVEPTADTDALAAGIESAVAGADATVQPDVDPGPIAAGIEGAVAGADATVEPTLAGDQLASDIEAAVASADTEVVVTADTSQVEAAVDSLASSAESIDFSGAGTGLNEADLQAQELNDTLSDLAQGSEQATDKLGATSNVSTTLATVFSAAKGDGRGLIDTLGHLGNGFGPVIAGTAAATAGFVGLFEAGSRSIAAFERVQTVLGGAADEIEHIHVGTLNGELGDLAVQAGVSGGALRQAAASAAQMGLSSGASKKEVTTFANEVNALALRAVALNPNLGEAGAAAERLNLVLGRGGRFLNRYGIDMTAAEITARALANTHKDTAKELTSFERSVAGAQIAVEKLGKGMGDDFQRGTEQSSVQLKRLRAELSSAFASAGKPLVAPTIEALDNLTGVATELSSILGSLGQAGLPALGAAFEVLGAAAAPVALLAKALAAVPEPILTLGIAAFGLSKAVGPLGSLLETVGLRMSYVGAAGSTLGKTMESTGLAVGNVGTFAQANIGKLAAFAASALVAAQSFGGIGHSAQESVVGIGSLVAAGASLGSVIPGVGTAAGAAAGFVVGLGKAAFTASDFMGDLDKSVTDLAKQLDSLGAKRAAHEFLDTLDTKLLDLSHNVPAVARELRILAEGDPAAANRVVEGIRQMGDASGFSAAQIGVLQVAADKGADTHAKHAKNAKEAADANRELEGAAQGTTDAVSGESAALQEANTWLQRLAESSKPAIDRAAELGQTIESEIAGKAPSVGDAFDKITKDLQAFTDSTDATPSLSGFTDGLTKSADDARAWIDTVHSLFDQGLTGLAALVLQRGPEASQGLVDSIRNSAPEQVTAWNDSVTAGIQGAAHASEDAKRLGHDIATALAGGVKEDPEDFVRALEEKSKGVEAWALTVRALINRGLFGLAAELQGMGADQGAKYVAGLNAADQATLDAWNGRVLAASNTNDRINQLTDANAPVAAGKARSAAGLLASEYATGVLPIPTSVDEAMLQAQAAITNKQEGHAAAGEAVGAAAHGGYKRGLEPTPPTADKAMTDAEAAIQAHDAQHAVEGFLAADAAYVAYDAALLPVPSSADEAMLQAQAAIEAARPAHAESAGAAGAAAAYGYGGGVAPIPGLAGDAINHGSNEIRAGSGDAGAAAGEVAGAVSNALGGMAADAAQHGRNVALGVAAGITEQEHAADVAAMNLALGIDATLAEFLKNTSPSKMGRKHGRWVTEGLALGIRDRVPMAEAAAANAAKATGAALEKAVGTATGPSGSTEAGRAVVREAEMIAQRAAAERAPTPPAGASPFSGPSSQSWSDDHSIRIENINNHGPDPDSRGLATTRRLRDVQHLTGVGSW